MNTKPTPIERETYRGATEIVICGSVVLDPRADLAERIMRQLSIICATPDGEDSAGRQRFRLMTPEEVAQRATDIADCAFEQFEKRDWLTAIPLPKPPKSKEEL